MCVARVPQIRVVAFFGFLSGVMRVVTLELYCLTGLALASRWCVMVIFYVYARVYNQL